MARMALQTYLESEKVMQIIKIVTRSLIKILIHSSTHAVTHSNDIQSQFNVQPTKNFFSQSYVRDINKIFIN